ncbi:MAG TPA: DUF4407 domain-containing protein [Candidatus Paceibacterota bacterium]|nr:DUF4407 domain-containing protein [Candidatus Paceibacterota bacterium]
MTLKTIIVLVAIVAIISFLIWKRKEIATGLENLLKFARKVSAFLRRQYKKISLGSAWFAGADLKILKDMPSSVIEKRASFGYTMFMAVIASAFIAAAVWGDIMDSFAVGLLIGVVWFFAIWMIDRSIMAFMDHDKPGKSHKKTAVIITRITLVVALSYINGTFAQLKIFEAEIEQKISEIKNDKIAQVNDSISNVLLPLENEKRDLAIGSEGKMNDYQNWVAMRQAAINTQRDSLRKREDLWIKEIEGLVGSGVRGYGPAAKAKREAITQDSIRLAEAIASFEAEKLSSPEYLAIGLSKTQQDRRTTEINASIAKIEAQKADRIRKINSEKADGLSHRYEALKDVAGTSLLVWAVFLMFFVFESLSIILKMMMGRDEYDEHIRLQREKFVTDEQFKISEGIQKSRDTHEINMNNLSAARAENHAAVTGKILIHESARLGHERSRFQMLKDHVNKMEKLFDDAKTPDAQRKRIVEEIFSNYKPVGTSQHVLN